MFSISTAGVNTRNENGNYLWEKVEIIIENKGGEKWMREKKTIKVFSSSPSSV